MRATRGIYSGIHFSICSVSLTLIQAHFAMDGVLYNYARRQRAQSESSPHTPIAGLNESMPTSELRKIGDTSAEIVESESQPLSPTQQSKPRGILKTPRVRFPEESSNDRNPRTFDYIQSPGEQDIFPSNPLQPPPPPPPPPTVQPIDLFGPSIQNDPHLNRIAYKLYTKFIDELEEFVAMQRDVISLRLEVQEKRQGLKIARAKVSECDVQLIDCLRQRHNEGKISADDPTYIELFTAAQEARDVAGPLEAEYEPLEIRLGSDENKLEQKYGMIETRFESFFRLHAESTVKQDAPSKIEYETDSTASAPEDEVWTTPDARELDLFHGAFIGESIGIGQMPRLMRDQDVAKQSARGVWEMKKHNRSADSTDLSARRRSNSAHDDHAQSDLGSLITGIPALDGLSQPQEELELREELLAHCLTGIDLHEAPELSDYPLALPDGLDLEQGPQDGRDLLLLENDSDTQSTLSDYLIVFEDVKDRVNRWLLHQLRLSPREVYALKREVTRLSVQHPNWASLALSVWPNDHSGDNGRYASDSLDQQSEGPPQKHYSVRPFPDVDP